MLDILIWMGLGFLLGLAVIGIVEILSTIKKLFDKWNNRRTVFLPIETLREEAKYNSTFRAVVNAIDDDDDLTGVYIEDDAVGSIHYQTITSDLKEDVNRKGYTAYRGDDRLYNR